MSEVLSRADHKYVEVADRIETLIEKEVFKIGDKLLSVRALSREQGISLSTAFQAYYELESKGLIEARPQSGYYVKYSPQHVLDLPKVSEPLDDALPVTIDDMINSVYVDLNSKSLLNFSMATPSIELLPTAKLNKAVVHALANQTQVVCTMNMFKEMFSCAGRLPVRRLIGVEHRAKRILL